MKKETLELSRKVEQLASYEARIVSEFRRDFAKARGRSVPTMKNSVPLLREIRRLLQGLDTLEIFNPKVKDRLDEIRQRKTLTDLLMASIENTYRSLKRIEELDAEVRRRREEEPEGEETPHARGV
jgi:hypothetical protein